MKSIFICIHIAIAMSSYNCAGSKKSASNKNQVKTENAESNNSMQTATDKKVFRFTVSFISKGGGIDFQIRAKYDAFITDFETRNKTKINCNKASWGREGEIDYCFEMDTLSKDLVEKFIAESKALLNTSDRINYGENTNCRGIIK